MNTGADDGRRSLEEVIAQGTWLRRFALGLVRDEDQAADIGQEAIITAWRQPPDRSGPLRPWLATVARNLVRSERRAADRRQVRERAAVESAEPLAESAEDRGARWELWKEIVGAVEGLREPLRRTVMQRYFDDLSSAEIARREGIPEATVRGRLKSGLDLLRQQLDGRHQGQRAGWVRLLLPLLPAAAMTAPAPAEASSGAGSAPPGGAGRGRPWLLPAAGGLVLVAVAASLVVILGGQPRSTPAGPASSGAAVPTGGGGPGGPAAPAGSSGPSGSAAVMPAISLTACLDQVIALRQDRQRLERELARTAGAGSMFALGQTNETATSVLRPFLARLIVDAQGQAISFDLTCRDLACRLQYLWPAGSQPPFWPAITDDPRISGRLAGWESSPGHPVRELLSGERLARLSHHFGLRRQDAAPAAMEGYWEPQRTPDPLPSDTTACQAEQQRLERAVQATRLAIMAGKGARHLYDESPPDPIRAAEVFPLVRAVFDRAWGRGTTVEVSCRGLACRLTVPAAWAKQHPDWLSSINGAPAIRELRASSEQGAREVAYLRFLPPGFEPGSKWLRDQVLPLIDAQVAAAVAACRPTSDTRGTLGVEMLVTTSGLANDQGEVGTIGIDQTGDLAGTSGGDCVAAIFRALVKPIPVRDKLWKGSLEMQYEWK
jgi:RNA polymerase sigma-70 factor (ECF subfamily)